MPDDDLVWTDLVRGEVRFAAGSVPDFVLVRGNGAALYPFVNPVDDALMEITDVLRGEDLLPSTPRQLALYSALTDIGVATGTPRFGHLPYVTGEGSKKLSKRDPQSNLDVYRERGFLPEGFANYLALLGWSIAEDRDIFSMAELAEAFDVTRVSANPARFDLKKAEAINATHLRALPVEEFIDRVTPYLATAGLVSEPPTAEQRGILQTIAPMAQERMIVLSEAVGLLRFLFVDDVEIEPAAAEKQLSGPEAAEVLDAATTALEGLPDWSTAAIEEALKSALVEGLGRKPRQAFGPVRVAVSGRTVSPPLYESIELLGRDRTLARLAAARAVTGGSPGSAAG
jgi:glutamyl-tRNA synthetase